MLTFYLVLGLCCSFVHPWDVQAIEDDQTLIEGISGDVFDNSGYAQKLQSSRLPYIAHGGISSNPVLLESLGNTPIGTVSEVDNTIRLDFPHEYPDNAYSTIVEEDLEIPLEYGSNLGLVNSNDLASSSKKEESTSSKIVVYNKSKTQEHDAKVSSNNFINQLYDINRPSGRSFDNYGPQDGVEVVVGDVEASVGGFAIPDSNPFVSSGDTFNLGPSDALEITGDLDIVPDTGNLFIPTNDASKDQLKLLRLLRQFIENHDINQHFINRLLNIFVVNGYRDELLQVLFDIIMEYIQSYPGIGDKPYLIHPLLDLWKSFNSVQEDYQENEFINIKKSQEQLKMEKLLNLIDTSKGSNLNQLNSLRPEYLQDIRDLYESSDDKNNLMEVIYDFWKKDQSGYDEQLIQNLVDEIYVSPGSPPVNPPGFPPVIPQGFPPVNPPGLPPVIPEGFPLVNPPGFPPVIPQGFPPVNPPGFPPVIPQGFSPVNPAGFPPVISQGFPPEIPPWVPPEIPEEFPPVPLPGYPPVNPPGFPPVFSSGPSNLIVQKEGRQYTNELIENEEKEETVQVLRKNTLVNKMQDALVVEDLYEEDELYDVNPFESPVYVPQDVPDYPLYNQPAPYVAIPDTDKMNNIYKYLIKLLSSSETEINQELKVKVVETLKKITSKKINIDEIDIESILSSVNVADVSGQVCVTGTTWTVKCQSCVCVQGVSRCRQITNCLLETSETRMQCKPYTKFKLDACNVCECNYEGIPVCPLKQCRGSIIEVSSIRSASMCAPRKVWPTCAPGTNWRSGCLHCSCNYAGISSCIKVKGCGLPL